MLHIVNCLTLNCTKTHEDGILLFSSVCIHALMTFVAGKVPHMKTSSQ